MPTADLGRENVIADFREELAAGVWRNDKMLRPSWNARKAELAPRTTHLSQNAAKNAIRNVGKEVSRWGGYRRALERRQTCAIRRLPLLAQGRRSRQLPGGQRARHRESVRPKRKTSRIGWVKMWEGLRFDGEVATVVVGNDGIRWYVSIGVDTGTTPPLKRIGESVGIDMGVQTLATLSDGNVIENPKALTLALASLRRVDKAIGRSRNTPWRNRQSNRREKLYSRLSGAIADAGMSSFLSILAYKSELYGAEIIRIDHWYGSSRICSGRGNRKTELALSKREYR